jgi:hypothetical protein
MKRGTPCDEMGPPDLISCLCEPVAVRRPFRPPALRWGAAKWPAQKSLHLTLNQHKLVTDITNLAVGAAWLRIAYPQVAQNLILTLPRTPFAQVS